MSTVVQSVGLGVCLGLIFKAAIGHKDHILRIASFLLVHVEDSWSSASAFSAPKIENNKINWTVGIEFGLFFNRKILDLSIVNFFPLALVEAAVKTVRYRGIVFEESIFSPKLNRAQAVKKLRPEFIYYLTLLQATSGGV